MTSINNKHHNNTCMCVRDTMNVNLIEKQGFIEYEKNFVYKFNNEIISSLYDYKTTEDISKIDYYKQKCVNCIFDIEPKVIKRAIELIYPFNVDKQDNITNITNITYSDVIYDRFNICKILLFGYSITNPSTEQEEQIYKMESELKKLYTNYIVILENSKKYKHLFIEEYDVYEECIEDEDEQNYLNELGKIIDAERDL